MKPDVRRDAHHERSMLNEVDIDFRISVFMGKKYSEHLHSIKDSGKGGNAKMGPVLEVTTSYLQHKYRVERKIESVNKDDSDSWVRISHGLNKLVTDLINREYDDNEQETCTTKTEVFASATRSKADLPLLAHLRGLFLFMKEHGLILNQELNSIKRTQWQKE